MLIDSETYVPGKSQPLRTLKVSEAIRIGASLRPQCKGYLFANGGSCVMGAAWEGFGFTKLLDGTMNADGGRLVWDWWRNNGWPSVWRENDGGQSREAIADWLEAQGL